MYTPYPPCCSIPFLRRVCEDSVACLDCGKVGFSYFDENRALFMMIGAFLSVLSIILCIVAAAAISPESDAVINAAWTVGTSDVYTVYVGLSEFVTKTGGVTSITSWDDTDCPHEYCSDCKDACASTVNVAILSVITGLPQLLTDIQRSTRKGDLNCQKVMGVLTGILGTLSTLSSLSIYADGCLNNLPEKDVQGNDYTWRYGPGFVCLLLATLLKPIDVILHMCTPVVKEGDGNLTNSIAKMEV